MLYYIAFASLIGPSLNSKHCIYFPSDVTCCCILNKVSVCGTVDQSAKEGRCVFTLGVRSKDENSLCPSIKKVHMV